MIFALLLYYEVGTPVVGAALIGIGLYVYRASGWFEGFFALFVIAVRSGGVALYEWASAAAVSHPVR